MGLDEAQQGIKSVLAAQGIRPTVSRRAILAALEQIDGPFTAKDLLRAVEASDPTVGRASVFRMLGLLRAHHLVEKLHGPGPERYILCLTEGHHHHVTCRSCGRTEAFAFEHIEALRQTLATMGFHLEQHVLQVFGTCSACLAKGAFGGLS